MTIKKGMTPNLTVRNHLNDCQKCFPVVCGICKLPTA